MRTRALSLDKGGGHLSVVDSNNRTNHLRNDDHVTKMGLHNSRLLVRWRLLFRLTQFFDESHRAAFQAALEPTACASVDDLERTAGHHLPTATLPTMSVYLDELRNQGNEYRYEGHK